MAREITRELLDEIQAGFNRQDVDEILSHFAEDCEWLMARGPNAPEGRRCKGKAEIGEVLIPAVLITDLLRRVLLSAGKAHAAP